MRGYQFASILLVLTIATFATASTAVAPWVNGDFQLGGTFWTAPASTTFVNSDGTGDISAHVTACGDRTWQLSRGISKGAMPASTKLSFDVKKGQLDSWSFRMILLSAKMPLPYANNLFAFDPTGTLQPDWNDDQVLAWEDWVGRPLAGHVVFDPVHATGYNIPGWATMSDAQRATELQGYTHMTLVIYGCASGYQNGATLDNFAWST